ncbi:unnamed protein product [Ectocarpus sp. CCAP 1310/34]|nr:unnamed protein product [Ectocarpus sp. CCAP 1310/34]
MVSVSRPAAAMLYLAAVKAGTAANQGDPELNFRQYEHQPLASPMLPPFLEGQPERWQTRSYGADVRVAPHTATGPGLRLASTGVPASFTIRLAGVDGSGARPEQQGEKNPDWDYNVDKKRFIYVWVASEDNVFVAGVRNNGNGTVTATYESSFPGDYLVHVEDVNLQVQDRFGRGRPIIGSPFSLTVSGDPAVDVDALPVCGGEGEEEDLASSYWRTGSWVSSNIAARNHGVLRDGWVFQPKTCVYEAFSYDDLMLLAGLDEPTWLLALGNSILRGIFLTILDMALAQGQKDDFSTSVVKKCWGFIDVRIGNLRISYQDLRLYTVSSVDDATVCNDEKLASGSTAAYVSSAELFLQDTIFRENKPWPSVIWAPSNMIDLDEAPNLQISVLMDALPSSWRGTLVMLDQLYGYGYGWNTGNPTLGTLSGVKPVNEFSPATGESGLERMERYRQQDPRVTFMSAFPMYQGRLFENEESRIGKRCYGCSIHYHYVSDDPNSPEAYGGAKMVHSAVTEMLANVLISKAVGTKAALRERAGTQSSDATSTAEERKADTRTFELCTDCPASLIPLHVKPSPLLKCDTVSALPGNATVGKAWDDERCPDWCMAREPERQASKGTGLVDVRVCETSSTGEGHS